MCTCHNVLTWNMPQTLNKALPVKDAPAAESGSSGSGEAGHTKANPTTVAGQSAEQAAQNAKALQAQLAVSSGWWVGQVRGLV